MGNDALDRMGADDARRRIAAMRELLDKAESTLTNIGAAPLGTAGDAAAIRADHLAKLQRLSGWALRDAVTDGLQHGMTWRWMGTACQLPVGTLHRQYHAGGRIVVRDNVSLELDYTDPQQVS
ncbi:hypothetical protein [Mycolicibacterium fortuitum]|uniref:hypothetical protein n=1 Tax=Mycolicibacterium fortuitum TaxID=1766 RepID=UPI001CE08D88|nr:hypothetical protein [Mycolicibacterium fortuitum]MCA4727152.1 hypothetical protein [Mycolicibacterium fortuitum]